MADEKKKAVAKADTSEAAKSEKKEKKEKKPKKHRVRRFFKDIKGETKKIVWPGRKMVIKSTGIVLAAILVIGAGIWILDFAISGGISAFNDFADNRATTEAVSTPAVSEAPATQPATDATSVEDTTAASEAGAEDEGTEVSEEPTTNA